MKIGEKVVPTDDMLRILEKGCIRGGLYLKNTLEKSRGKGLTIKDRFKEGYNKSYWLVFEETGEFTYPEEHFKRPGGKYENL